MERTFLTHLPKAARYLHKKAPDHRRAIILVSDNCSLTLGNDVKGAKNELLEANATLYNIRTIDDNPEYSTNSFCIEPNRTVKEITDMTGGELLELGSSTSLQMALKRAITNIRYQYTLGFTASNPGQAGSYHTLDVRLRNPNRCLEGQPLRIWHV